MKRKYSNKYANKKTAGQESPVVGECGKGTNHKKIARLLASAMSLSAICGTISGYGERKEESNDQQKT